MRSCALKMVMMVSLLLAACGGGGGGSSYSISVTPGSVALQGLTNGPPAVQNVAVTFKGDGIVVGTLPGQTVPSWLSVRALNQTTTSATVEISGSAAATPGNYSITLRFVTGKSDGSKVTSQDVPVSFELKAGQTIQPRVRGIASGSSLAVSLNNGAPVTLATGEIQQNPMGPVAVGSSYTLSIPAQPTGQHCTFSNGSATLTETAVATLMQQPVSCNAALLPWTWVGGSKAIADAAVHGTRGTAAATNTPGGRLDHAWARDATGNLWVFGGRDSNGLHNDLWRYDIGTRQWTWVSGSNSTNATAVYGTRDTAAPGNVPGARFGSTAWIDGSGRFWLFGGDGFTSSSERLLNDLWMYDPVTGNWTWHGGSNSANVLDALGTYGTTPATTNIPGGRGNMSVTAGAGGTFWLFGGNGLGDANSFGRMNDLWKFDPATRVWSWMGGSSQPLLTRVQGTLGVPDAANYPSGRDGASLWADASDNVWVFGGSSQISGFENDLWRFNSISRVWTWMGGTDRTSPAVVTSQGTYNPPGTTTSDYPTSRMLAGSWTDAAGNFWLFGGNGQGPTTGASNTGALNDLWKYSPATNSWSWLGGSNAPVLPPVYGTQGVAANTNVPGGRIRAASWLDTTGHLWLWGGAVGPNPDQGASEVWFATPP